jgi:2-polyprenyl-6-hydroxyphenyl methylase/3-demethylubiquinone-9 3-methyltransferase
MTINNSFYDSLGEDWNGRSNHPIALLRAENRLRNPWIAKTLSPCSKVLDVGCGAGFLTNYLASLGHEVYGVDLSPKSLKIAQEGDLTRSVKYHVADAVKLPFPNASFDAVAAMDLLEHVESPLKVVSEAGRLLKPGGLFFFHTFNRNFLSWLVVIKGVEWCVKNTPNDMHVYPLFIKPDELKKMCAQHELQVEKILGVRPKFLKLAFLKLVLTRTVSENFEFKFSRSLATGYSGFARKSAV